ncbi:hypothetical protein JHD47_02960 [Sulfurimonas sp. SAG-AH-194-L11]|nr:hypothetical protein [Sulfurimonas sp. SAG-AH-194-L11]MDF1876772.1 hypothetical protein [Sulfurimonas sp. SAG-AH-194-L11]
MKQLIKTSATILLFTLFTGCVTNPKVTPSQNRVLNSISKSNAQKKESYFLQKQTDAFLKKEWKENVLEDKEIQEKYEKNKNRGFSLQEYVDKVEVYSTKKEKSATSSNVSKLQTMPVIGK